MGFDLTLTGDIRKEFMEEVMFELKLETFFQSQGKAFNIQEITCVQKTTIITNI